MTDLPADNAARLAIYDAFATFPPEVQGVSNDALFDRVIGRLRVLVPRELHLAGDREYVESKIEACIAAGVLSVRTEHGERVLTLGNHLPQIRYPAGEIREYTAGLEPARERLDRDNSRLRDAQFDVRRYVPSIADAPAGPEFQALLSSMREHGFMKHFPVVKYHDDVVLDGRARVRAAATLNLEVEYFKYASEKDRTAARRRDTPLNRIMVASQSNSGRLSEDELDSLHNQVANVTGREWLATLTDLEVTAEWRRSTPVEYSPVFEVRRIAFRPGDEAKIQVTVDDKVMLRSLIEAAGLSNYKIDILRDYVPFESARTVHSGRKAMFSRAADMINGIAVMQAERSQSKLKVDPEWELIRKWLVETFVPTGG